MGRKKKEDQIEKYAPDGPMKVWPEEDDEVVFGGSRRR